MKILSSLSRHKKILPYVFVSFLILSTFWISTLRPLDRFEHILLDLRYQFRPSPPVSDDIVIIQIADDTLAKLNYWPLPRDFHASLVDVLKEVGVKQVFFDLIFTDKTDNDLFFEKSIRKADNVYLPYVLNIEEKAQFDHVPQAQGIVAPIIPTLKKAAKDTGHINSYVDDDGKVRWVPLFVRDGENLYPQSALLLASHKLNLPLKEITFKKNHVIIDRQLRIPTTASGAMLVNFAGRWKDTFRHYSYVDILAAFKDKMEGKTPRIDLNELKDTTCFVGLTATGTPDIKPIPYESSYPLVGLHSNVLNSIIQSKYVYRVSKPINLIILLGLIAIIVAICIRIKLRPFVAFLCTLVACLSFVGFSLLLFIFAGAWIDVAYPLCVAIILYIGMTIYNFIDEHQKRELLEKELSIAQTIQESFLPKSMDQFQNLEIASRMTAAKHVGGDLYDLKRLNDDTLGVLIGDVSGKGVGAALVMAKTITTFRMLVHTSKEPGDLMFKLNNELSQDLKPGMFVTATYLMYEAKTSKVKLASAGHSATLVLRNKDASIESVVPEDGMPLGIMANGEYSQEEILLNAGDKIAVYSDGVSEAMNKKREEFGEERFHSALRSSREDPPKETIEAVIGAISRFAGKAPQHDDCTIIVLRSNDSH